jgi:hypothetical protein
MAFTEEELISKPTTGPLFLLENNTLVINYINIVIVMISLYICTLRTVYNSIANGGFRKILAEPINLGSDTLLLIYNSLEQSSL